MSFTCRYCGNSYCSTHRLPENHDCEGLEKGLEKDTSDLQNNKSESTKKIEEKQEKETAKNNQWFENKDLKEEKRRKPHTQKHSLFRDIINTLKTNYTLSIIVITSIFFVIGEIFPEFNNLLTLYPAIDSQSAVYGATLLERPWGLLTVMLVHGNFIHLFVNMVTLYFFASTLERRIGSKNLLKFYIAAGLFSSIALVAFSNVLYLLHGAEFALRPAVGASGAVVATVGLVAKLYPHAEVLLYFLFPMKIKTAVYAFGALEVFNMTAKLLGYQLPIIGGFASSAHLAGLLIGLYVGEKIKDKYSRRASIDIFQ